MSDRYNEEFKTTLMGGYDKEDVQTKFKEVLDESYAEKSKLTLEIENKNSIIKEKDELIAQKDAEIAKLRKDISEKYQSYIDNYDTIGKIVYEARINSDKILNEAKEKSDNIITEATNKAKHSIDKAQLEVDRKLAEGKRRYNVLQEEINELIQLVNQVQHKFMQSFKAIHEISGAMPAEETDLDFDESFDDENE